MTPKDLPTRVLVGLCRAGDARALKYVKGHIRRAQGNVSAAATVMKFSRHATLFELIYEMESEFSDVERRSKGRQAGDKMKNRPKKASVQ